MITLEQFVRNVKRITNAGPTLEECLEALEEFNNEYRQAALYKARAAKLEEGFEKCSHFWNIDMGYSPGAAWNCRHCWGTVLGLDDPGESPDHVFVGNYGAYLLHSVKPLPKPLTPQ